MRMELGQFAVTTGEFVLSDPCYELDVQAAYQGVLKDVLTGKRHAYVEKIDAGDWGVRCAALVAYHESLTLVQAESSEWMETELFVGVDSGQAGIFDVAVYQNSETVTVETSFDPDNKWYSRCCDLTLSEVGAGVINGGAVSSSGFGDGGYGVFVLKNGQGQVVGVTIEFITEEDLLEEEEA